MQFFSIPSEANTFGHFTTRSKSDRECSPGLQSTRDCVRKICDPNLPRRLSSASLHIPVPADGVLGLVFRRELASHETCDLRVVAHAGLVGGGNRRYVPARGKGERVRNDYPCKRPQ